MLRIYFATFLMGLVLQMTAQTTDTRKVVITIDDLPLVSKDMTKFSTFRYVTNHLLSTLQEYQVPAIGFVNEKKLYQGNKRDEQKIQLLQQWLEAGMELGNHAYAHLDYHRVSIEAFQKDILDGEIVTKELLAEAGQEMEYFRHPFLHTGNSPEKKVALEKFLEEHGYEPAPVTIDNSEWIYARAYDLALIDGDSAMMKKLGTSYLEYMEAKTAFYEKQSVKLFDREIPQILLIHANIINADYLAPLLDIYKKRGYQFIALEEALKDPAFESPNKYVGMGGITWIDRWALTAKKPKEFYRGEPLCPEFVKEVAKVSNE